MKPYNKINLKAVTKAALIILGMFILFCLLARPATVVVLWIYNSALWFYSVGDYFTYTFCNPTLWFLGFDELMWEYPVTSFKSADGRDVSGEGAGFGFLCILSTIAHIATLIFTIKGFNSLWKYIDKKK